MNWGGKLIGGTLGLLVFGPVLGPIGAAIGVFIGHQFDTGAVPAHLLRGVGGGAGPDPRLVNQLFFPTTFQLMGHIAKADGRVSEQEIASARAIMQALHLREAQVQSAIAFFNEGKQPGFDVDAALRRLRIAIAPYPELVVFFVEIQLQSALAGNGLPPLLRARIQRMAATLGLGSADFERLESLLRFRMGTGAGAFDTGAFGGGQARSRFGHEQRVAHAYEVLGASPTMSDDEVVKCYRRQMSRHHPDKLQANGLPESMLERAKERAQEIQVAYELIRAERGLR
jgi:DnaJ like chaperone protein